MSTNLRKKVSNFSKNPKNIISGPILGQDWLRKTQPNVCSKRRDSESWTDIDRQKQPTAPWNLNGARSLGAPTHPLVTVFTKRPVIGVRRRPGVWYKHIWALLCRKQATKFLDPSLMEKKMSGLNAPLHARPFAPLTHPQRPSRHSGHSPSVCPTTLEMACFRGTR